MSRKKKIALMALLPILIYSITYINVAFVVWEFDAAKMPPEARFVVSIMGTVLLGFTPLIANEIKTKDND